MKEAGAVRRAKSTVSTITSNEAIAKRQQAADSPSRSRMDASQKMNVNGYITDRDVRAARELLRWSQQDLREKSGVGLATVRRFETGATITDDCKDKLVACLSKAGVIFFGRIEIEGVAVARGLALRPGARPKRAPKKRVYAARKPKEPVESSD